MLPLVEPELLLRVSMLPSLCSSEGGGGAKRDLKSDISSTTKRTTQRLEVNPLSIQF